MSKIQVLITGASGFVGHHFVNLYSQTYDLKIVKLRTVEPENCELLGVQTVVHLAALVHQMKGAPAEQYFKINFELTKRLAAKAKLDGVSHFIYMSTAHVYGQYGNIQNPLEKLSETSECRPIDPYGQSKLAAEKMLLELTDQSFKVSIIRSPLVYGEGGKGNLNSLLKLIRRVPILPFKHSENKRSLIFVENLAYFIHLLIQSKQAGIFLPQDDKPLSIQEIVQLIAQKVGSKVLLFKLPKLLFYLLNLLNPKIMQRLFGSLALDSINTNSVLGYKPLVSTEKAFQRTFGRH